MAQQGHRRADAVEFQARRVNGAGWTLTRALRRRSLLLVVPEMPEGVRLLLLMFPDQQFAGGNQRDGAPTSRWEMTARRSPPK
jgi:hypothetical protein